MVALVDDVVATMFFLVDDVFFPVVSPVDDVVLFRMIFPIDDVVVAVVFFL